VPDEPRDRIDVSDVTSVDTSLERRGSDEAGSGSPAGVVAEIDGRGERHRFTDTFRIGRGDDCELVVEGSQVSRAHAEVFWANRRWRVRDLGSTNGTFLEGLRVETAELGPRNALRLGAKGPVVWLTVEGLETDATPSLGHYLRRYAGDDEDRAGDGHTGMIRRAFDVARRRQRLRFAIVLTAVSVVLLGAALLGWRYRVTQLERARDAAGDLFYTMKALELRLRDLESRLGGDSIAGTRAQLADGRSQLDAMGDAYDRYLEELELFSDSTPPEARTVLRTARVFGECEAAMPTALVDEVLRYVEGWRASTRLEQALERARRHGYLERAAEAFDEVHLPPEYGLIALQESDFRVDACGPKTRFGIAKGAWQFIPATARAYGLRVGPLFRQRRPDPEDQRHDFDLAAAAAARYIRDIYVREAQGSGLLVLAIYNHGGGNVRRLLRSLPETPAERNFWKVLLDHRDRFPPETYDYVLKIFSAAVICDDPSRFGFDLQCTMPVVGTDDLGA
jgi:hypothetical protein